MSRLRLLFLLFALIAAGILPSVKAASSFTKLLIDADQAPLAKSLGDLDGDGYLDAVIAGGSNLGSSVYWYRYPSWTKYFVGSIGGGDDLQIKDVNGDGAADIIVSGGIYWYENPRATGGNIFAQWPVHSVDSGMVAHDLVAADMNNDGRLDIVARGEFGPTFLYLQNSADSWTKVPLSQSSDGLGTAVADIDRDGKLDVVQNGFWLKQPQDLVSGSWVRYNFAAWPAGCAVSIADINKDGRIDVVLGPLEHDQLPRGLGFLTWFEAPADPINGSWIPHVIGAGQEIHRLQLADIDHNGELDVVFAEMHESDTHRVGVYFNDGRGSSWTLQTLSSEGSHNIAVGDIGNDGDIDILGANWRPDATDGGAVNLWLNNASSISSFTLDDWTYVEADNTRSISSSGLTFGDLNGDGLPDIISGSYWYRNPGGNLTGSWMRTDLGGYDAMFALDVEGNGKLDLIAEAYAGSDVGVYWLVPANADATLWSHTLIGVVPSGAGGGLSRGYRFAQIVPGGRPEFVLTSGISAYYFQVPPNPEAGNWPRTEISSEVRDSGIDVEDIDGDGDPDLAGFVSPSGVGVAWWENPGTGAGSWVRHDIGITTGIEGGRLAISEINGDGRKDVVVTEANLGGSGNSLIWFEHPLNSQDSNWTRRMIASDQGSLDSMDAADMDHDGTAEVITGESQGARRVVIWKTSDAGENWTPHVVSTGLGNYLGTKLWDLDGDGDLDVVGAASDAPQFLHIWRNNASENGPIPDTTPPAVSITSPTEGVTISQSSVTVSASASDNLGVAGVQFLLDGTNLGLEVTASPYSVIWNTGVVSGSHTLAARARDAAGNITTSSLITVTVASAPTAGLTAGYAFDEVAGTTAPDISGHGIFGTLINGPAWTPGRYGNALTFDGADDYVDLGNPTALQMSGSMTLSGWINASAFPADDAAVVSKRDSGSSGFQLDLTPDTGNRTIGFKLTSSTGESMFRYGATTLEVNTWYHIAGVYDAAAQNLHVYLNGQLDDGALVGTVTDSQENSTANVTIGRRAGVTGYEFAGRVDDLRIYDRALTMAEIQTDMGTPVGTIGSTDPNPPDVHLEEPADGALVSDIIVIEAHATDDVAVFGVQFFVDGVPAGLLDTEAPYALTWDTRSAANGAHTLTAKAYDTSANSAVSPPVSVNVSNANFFRNEILVTGLNLPTAIKFLPDGRLLVVELAGTIKVLPAPYTEPDSTAFLQLTNVGSAGVQQGVYDLALDPDFSTNHYYYIFYTHGTPNRDRLSRFTADATLTGTIAGSETVLYQDPQDSSSEHHGGAIAFGNDGKIYFTTGEQFGAADSQLLSSPRGKLHRINRDGTVPTDNPYYDGAGPNWDSIWAIGLRNPFRAYFDAPTDRLLIGDVGGNDYSTAREEVNIGVRGANYGWPNVEGTTGDPAYTNPLYAYPHNGRDASITGGFVYHGTQFPSSYQGSYFFADYTQNWIRRLTFDASGNVTGVFNFEPADGSADGPYGDIVYLTEGPDGALYYVDLGFSDIGSTFGVSKIRRIQYIQSDLPPVVAASATPTNGATPLTVDFSSAGSSDPEGLPLTYLWTFGDGQSSTAANPQHTYLSAGLYQARLSVSDGVNSTLSLPISIRAGNAPVATLFTTPSNGGLFRAGDTISYNAQATDVEDGSLPASAFTWNIDFLHEGHVHPGIAISGVTSGSFTIPTSGHDFSGFTRYRITLTVTDSDGLKSSQTATVFPDKVNLTFDTVPSGLTLKFDGINFATPFVRDDVIGFQHDIEAPNQVVGSNDYVFSSWSDGGSQIHSVITPTTNQLNTATFSLVVPDNSPPVISNVSASAITLTGATIQWTTDEASDTRIEFGLTIGYGQSTTLNSALVTAHSAALTGLTENTTYHYRVLSRDAAGNLATSSDFTFTTADSPLTVEEFVPSSSGFTIRFNRPLDPATLNMYGTETGGFGSADVTVTGSTNGLIHGSLLINSLAGQVAFIRTGGILLPDTYTVTLRSAADAFRDLLGGLLDGNHDGIRGDGFTTAFTVVPNTVPVLSISDFTRGAGQPVDIGVTPQGIPVTLSDGANVQSVDMSVSFDPALLVVASVVPGSSLPAGAQVQTDLSNPGQIHVTISSAIPLSAGAIELVRLIAQVPDSAPYRARQILRIGNISLNDGALAAIADDALHVAAYLGDTTGNGNYSSLDAQRVLRVAAGLDSGFAAYITTDAVIIGDVSANGAISSLDATRILQEVAGLPTVGIPPLPGIPVPTVSSPGSDSF